MPQVEIASFQGHRKWSAEGCDQTEQPSSPQPVYRLSWARLLARVFRVDVTECPACGGKMKIIAALTEPVAIRTYLDGVGLASRPPPIAPAPAVAKGFGRQAVFSHRPNSNTRVKRHFHLCATGRSASSRCPFCLRRGPTGHLPSTFAEATADRSPKLLQAATQRFKRPALAWHT